MKDEEYRAFHCFVLICFDAHLDTSKSRPWECSCHFHHTSRKGVPAHFFRANAIVILFRSLFYQVFSSINLFKALRRDFRNVLAQNCYSILKHWPSIQYCPPQSGLFKGPRCSNCCDFRFPKNMSAKSRRSPTP